MREALLEIDFQGWIVRLGHDEQVVHRARRARQQARERGALLVCSRYLSTDPEDRLRSDPDGEGARWAPGLEPEPGDLVLTKTTRDITDNPDLHANLVLAGVGLITITGIATDHGVALAARSLHRLGYRVRVVPDACAATSPAAHRATLDRLAASGIEMLALECAPASTVGE